MKRKKQLLKEKKDIVRFMRLLRKKTKIYLFFKNEIAGINGEIAENKEVRRSKNYLQK